MYCKDCKFRQVSETDNPVCNSESIRELDTLYKESGSRLLYSYPENGRFYVEDYFGCVHFEEKKDERVLYACGYKDSDGSYGMWAGPSPSLLEMELYVPQEDEYPAFIIQLPNGLFDAVIVRKWVNGRWVE